MTDDEIKEVLVSVYDRYNCKNDHSQPTRRMAANEAALELIDGLTVNNVRTLVTTLCQFCMFGEPPCSTTKDSHE